MINFEYKERYSLGDLRAIMAILRSENGCPWDREQTHRSIRRDLLEEAYETADAIDTGDVDNLREELGDLLLQVVFHAQIEAELHRFDFDDVCDGICRKLIYRHPHVFGDLHLETSDEVLETWDAAKRREKAQKSTAQAMESVAKAMPALWRAEKVQKKARKDGFDWPDWHGAKEKLAEELTELEEAVATGERIEEELGDVLAAAVNMARLLGVDPEKALNGSTDRFISRYTCMEHLAAESGQALPDMDPDTQEALWQKAKAMENP